MLVRLAIRPVGTVGGCVSAAALGMDSTVKKFEIAVKPSRTALACMGLRPWPVPPKVRLSPASAHPAGRLPTMASVASGLPGSDR